MTSYTALPVSGSSATTNYIATSATLPITSAESINALLIIGDGVTVSGSALTVGTGVIAASDTGTNGNTISAPIVLGAEGIVTTNNSTLTVSGSISGTAGLTIGGGGTLALPNTNGYTGATNINSGTVSVGNSTSLGLAVSVPNASFEAPSEGVTFAYNPVGAGWNFVGNSGISANGSGFSSPTAPDGTQVALVQQVGNFSQNIFFSAPGNYTITFLTAGRPSLGPNPFKVLLDGVQIGATVVPLSTTSYNTVTIPFTITSAGFHNLGFAGQNTSAADLTSFIDNISISASSALNFNGGALQTSSPGVTLSNPLTFNSSVVSFTGANPITFAGTVTLNGFNAANIVANNLLAVTNTGGVTFAGQVANSTAQVGTLSLLGGGTLYLTNAFGASNSYTGQTTIVSGIINAQQASSLGVTSNVVVAGTGAALQLQSAAGFTLARSLILNGNGVNGNGAVENVYGNNILTGTVTLNTSTNVGVDAGTLGPMTGAISGPGDLNKVGLGLFAINASSPSWTGQFNINQGIVRLDGGQYAMGNIASGTVVNSGASLQLNASGGVFQAETITLNGNGIAGTLPAGALVSIQANTVQGNIILNSGATLGGNAALTLPGIVSGADLTKVGTGTLTLQAPNTYVGNTNVLGGTLTVNGAGSILGTGTTAGTGVNLFEGTTLTLDNNGSGTTTAINLANRVNNSTPWTFNGGTLNFFAVNPSAGAAPLSSSQTIGAVTLASGQATISSGWAAASGVAGTTNGLTITSLNRQPGATLIFNGSNVDLSGPTGTTITATNGAVQTAVATIAATAATEVGNVVTITTSAVHGFAVGQTVVINGLTPSGFNGTYTILSVPSTTTFTYADANSGLGTSAGTAGTANVNTVTITTSSAHGFSIGQTVSISGVTLPGYNGAFTIVSVPSATTFTVTNNNSGLAASGGGIAAAAIGIAATSGATESGNTVTITTPTIATTATGVSEASTAQATIALGAAIETGNVVAVTTSANHNFVVGQSVVIAGVTPAGFNGTFTITGILSPTSFTYTDPTAALGTSTGAGTASVTNTVTVTTATAHNLLIGQTVVISGVTPAAYNGTYVVTSIPSPTTFTYTSLFTGLATSTAAGTVQAAHGLVTGQTVTIAGVGVSGYNGTYTITSIPNAATFTYTDATSSLAVSGSGTAILEAPNQLLFTNAPGLTTGAAGSGILPYALVTGPAAGGTDFATVSGSNLVRFTNYTTALVNGGINTAANTGTVYKEIGSEALTGNVSLNGLLISGAGLTLTSPANATLTLTGGGLIVVGGSDALNVPTLAFGTTEGIVTTASGRPPPP